MVRFLHSGFGYSSVDLLFSWEEKILKQVGAGQSAFFLFFLMCMSVFLISLCTMCTPGAQGGRRGR